MGRKRFKVATEPIFNYWRLMHQLLAPHAPHRLPSAGLATPRRQQESASKSPATFEMDSRKPWPTRVDPSSWTR